VDCLLSTWNNDRLGGWREREGVVRLLTVLAGYQYDVPSRSYLRSRQLRDILLKGLGDGVASVRGAGVSTVPSLFFGWRSRQRHLWGEFVQDLARMARDGKYSRRITFVATQQELLLHGPGSESLLDDTALHMVLEKLACDHIPGVRIGIARLIKLVCDKYYSNEKPEWMLSTLSRLSQDESKDARAFAVSILQPQSTIPAPDNGHDSESDFVTTPAHHTFSRPPPPSVTDSIWVDMLPIAFKPVQNGDERNHAEVLPSLGTLKNGYDHETKGVTSKTKDGIVTRPGFSSRTKNDRVSR